MMMPLLLNLKGKYALVVGGGQVAARRIYKLLANGLQVKAVSTKFTRELLCVDNRRLTRIRSAYHIEELEGMDLVVAASGDSELNAQIRRDCASLNILCNRVDDPDDSDFIFPGVIRRGDLTLSVCTEGAGPFLTKKIIEDLSDRYDERYTIKTELLRALREIILASEMQPADKTELLRKLPNCTNSQLRTKLEELSKDVEVMKVDGENN